MPEISESFEKQKTSNPIELDLPDTVRELNDADFLEQAGAMAHSTAGLPIEDPRYASIPFSSLDSLMPKPPKEMHFVLPGNVGGEGEQTSQDVDTTVRESYDRRARMYAGGSLVKVGQGEMYYFGDNRSRLIYVPTTTCSTMVATHEDGRVAVAHISMSETGQIVPTLQKLRDDGFAMDKVWATAAVGPAQEQESDEIMSIYTVREDLKARRKRFGVEDYVAEGIPREHVFTYEPDKRFPTPGTSEYIGGETFIAMLDDGTVRLVAGSHQFTQEIGFGIGTRPTAIVPDSGVVLGSGILRTAL